MNKTQQLLQISAKLFQHLTDFPEEEKRDDYIDKINHLLDERGILMEQMQREHFVLELENKSHRMLVELDNGIRERLNNVMKVIQNDLKELQNAKKHEQQYMNPYASVQVMDGRYYDKKN